MDIALSIDHVCSWFGMYTAALLCFVSDILATRKICGFPNFNGKFGCSKCLKTFSCEHFSGPTDYSGYNRENWIPRSQNYHKTALKVIQACKLIQ